MPADKTMSVAAAVKRRNLSSFWLPGLRPSYSIRHYHGLSCYLFQAFRATRSDGVVYKTLLDEFGPLDSVEEAAVGEPSADRVRSVHASSSASQLHRPPSQKKHFTLSE